MHMPWVSEEPQEKAGGGQEVAAMGVTIAPPWQSKAGTFSQLLGCEFYSAAIRFLPFLILLHERPREGDKSVKYETHPRSSLCHTHGQEQAAGKG